MSHWDKDNIEDMTLDELHGALQWLNTKAPSSTEDDRWEIMRYRGRINQRIQLLQSTKESK